MSKPYTSTASTTIEVLSAIVWDPLTDPETIKQWFFGSEVETDWEVGSPIYFRSEWEDGSYENKGEIQRFDPERVLEYSHWSPLSGKPDVPENYHTVTWGLSRVSGGTQGGPISESLSNATDNRRCLPLPCCPSS